MIPKVNNNTNDPSFNNQQKSPINLETPLKKPTSPEQPKSPIKQTKLPPSSSESLPPPPHANHTTNHTRQPH